MINFCQFNGAITSKNDLFEKKNWAKFKIYIVKFLQ